AAEMVPVAPSPTGTPTPSTPVQMPTPTDERRLEWFNNLPPGQVFDPTPFGSPPKTPVAMDYSLQLAISVRSWDIAANQAAVLRLTHEQFLAEYGPDILRSGEEPPNRAVGPEPEPRDRPQAPDPDPPS